MLPGNRTSTTPVPGAFIGSASEPMLSRTFDFEDGPIAIQDPTQGIRYQQWRSYIKDEKVFLEADNQAPEVILTGGGITDISIAFDQNANLHYCWVDDGTTRLRWYNTTTSQMDTMVLPSGIRTPKLTMDDKRPSQSGIADILLVYIKSDNSLCHRRQRDRFNDEIILDAGPWVSLEKVGMNNGMRFQFMLSPGDPEE